MATATYRAERAGGGLRRVMWVLLIVLCAIGGAAALRRMYALGHPNPTRSPKEGERMGHPTNAQLAGLDEQFVAKAGATLLHIVPALVLIVIVPFQFSRTFRARHLRTHRWMGRVAVTLGLVVGLSGLELIRHPVGGASEVSAILVFDAIFLVSLITAFVKIRAGRVAEHREWMIRAMSVIVGVATVRPVMGVFFALSRVNGMTPREFFGIAFWIGFTATYLVGEWWIRYSRLPNCRTAELPN